MLRVRVLGSAAGGGFPQWNCGCENCAGLAAGTLSARARTQSSIALTATGTPTGPADESGWLLVNASPDIRAQILACPDLRPALRPGHARRATGIAAVLLTDSQIDHAAGLLMLREHTRPLRVFTTRAARQDLTAGFPVLTLLGHYCGVDWQELPSDGRALDGASVAGDCLAGLSVQAVPLAGKAPPYSPHRADPRPGDTVGLLVRDTRTGRALFYAPGLAGLDARVRAAMGAADLLLVDGTCFHDDELARRGVGRRRARDMGHLPLSGPGGLTEAIAPFARQRKVLIHINNTNPILDEASPERAALHAAGIELAFDGMEIRL